MRIQHLALTALLGLGLAAGCADQADPDVEAGAEEVIELTEPAEAAPAEAEPADLEPDVEEDEEQEESEE